MNLGLDGRTAIVAASTSGLGLASAKALSQEGANVVIFGRRGELAQKEAAALPSALGIEADLASPEAPLEVTQAALDRFGGVDILVWNSGGPPPGRALDLTSDDFVASEALLIRPFLSFYELLVPSMIEGGWGRIVAIGSSGVQQPIPNLALSNALRSAVASLCKTLAGEVASGGVTVNMVIPGRIATDRVAELDRARAQKDGLSLEDVVAQSKHTIPAGRYGEPREFAAAVAFIASERASYITGTQIRVDGGMINSTR